MKSFRRFCGPVSLGCVALAAMLSATGTRAQTTPKTAITMNQLADWNFGEFFTGSGSGSVTITTSGTRSASGGVVLFNTAASDPHPASFEITGDTAASYSILFPSSITLTVAGGTQTMTLDHFTKTGTGVLTNGKETIQVGATLNIGATQANGPYSGTNFLTTIYN